MAHYPKLTPEKKDKFYALIRETGNVSKAAMAIDIARVSVYWHKRHDPEFSDAWDDAKETWIDNLEEEGGRRAYGADRIIFDKEGNEIQAYDAQGEQISLKTRPSDTLLIFYMKANREKYKDKIGIGSDQASPLNAVLSFVGTNASKDDKS